MSALRTLADALENAYLMGGKYGRRIYVRPTPEGLALDLAPTEDAIFSIDVYSPERKPTDG